MLSSLPRRLHPIKVLAQFIRFWNLFIIALTQYFTAFFLISHDTIWDIRLFFLCLSNIMIAMAGYVVNDYFDIKIDLINKPEKVVVGRSIHRRYAIILHSVISFFGTVLGFLLAWSIGLINFLSVVLLWFYSHDLKRKPFIGNISIAAMVAMSILIVGILYSNFEPLIFTYALFAFMMTLVREIIKDMQDFRGDEAFGCKTLPIIWGLRKTKKLIYAIIILLALSAFILNQLYIKIPIGYLAVYLVLPLIYLWARLVEADTVRDFDQLSLICKLIMILGIFSMAWIR